MMYRLFSVCAGCVLAAVLAAILPLPSDAQEQFQFESDLVAKGRVFAAVGPGFRAIHRGPNGSYYILTAPATALQIYDASGTRTGQIPSDSAMKAKGAALVYGESFDVDRDGRVAVCDRGADAVKIYSPNGSLLTTIPLSAPESVIFLPDGEVSVASPSAEHLVTVYDLQGKLIREYGDREEIADRADVNTQANFGHLGADEIGNTYFAFDYLPEPTVRKFDHAGYLSMEISLTTLEFQPAAQAARKALSRPSERGTPALHRIISAIGVDARTQDVWLAIGTLLMHFDKDGQRIASFRTYLPRGARMEPATILVEADRLVIAADPQGIYEFPKPGKLPQ
jgi:hypothetical protein